MEQLFSSDLISGSVKTQRDLDTALAKHSNLSTAYIQTALYWEDLRKWYEEHWPKVYKFLDKDFLNRFKMEAEHTARAWELHFAGSFFDKGLKFEEKTWDYGPDFCIKLPSGKKIWIEAVACDLGTVDPVPSRPVLVPGVIYSFTGNIEEEHRTRALRITSAIASKFEKYKNYLNNPKSGVSKDDCFIVAINGEAIQYATDSGMLFKRAVFGVGPAVFVKSNGQDELKGPFYKPVPTIIKKTGDKEQEIPANFMEMDEFDSISAVVYCGNSVHHSLLNGYNPGDHFLFAYHTNPKNPIPADIFKFGRSIRKNRETQQVFDTDQK